jgi:hypothetical protein
MDFKCPSLAPDHTESESRIFGVLAKHPAFKECCREIRAIPTFNNSMAMTNKGLQITLPVLMSSSNSLSGILNCYSDADFWTQSTLPTQITLPLRISHKGPSWQANKIGAGVEFRKMANESGKIHVWVDF